MRKFTNLMRLMTVILLSLTMVMGYAQRTGPFTNKAPQQLSQTMQPAIVQSGTTMEKAQQDVAVDKKTIDVPVSTVWSQGISYVEKPISNEPYDPSKYPAPDQGGETVATALVINPAVNPYTDAGTTSGYINDYDEACTYTGSTSPDVCYSYTPTANVGLDIDLCASSYDTKVYVYQNAVTPGSPYACNDDYYFAAPCYTYSSAIFDMPAYAGNTYYIVIDGYGGASGAYSMTVTSGALVPPPYNDECTGAIVQTLTYGVPATFTGNNLGATVSYPSIFNMPDTWEAFTLPGPSTVVLDYCSSGGGTPWGNVWLNLGTDCPLTAFTAAGTWETTTCGDGNITITWIGLAAGTYYYPVMLDPAYNSVGAYTIHVVANPVSGGTGCENTSMYPGSAITVNSNLLTTISTCNYAQEYSQVTGIQAGQTYQFTMSNLGTGAYITITDGPGTSGNILTYGPSPLNWTATSSADLYAHWTLNEYCATDASCHTTTVQCLTCTGYPAPPNDLCSNAQAVTGPYPVVGLPGTTLGATMDCPAWLTDAGGEVWYAITLPYALNNLTIVENGDASFNDGYIVGTFVQCSCVSSDYIFYSTYTFTPPTFTLAFNELAGPGTFYYPVTTGTQGNFTLNIDVQVAVPCVVECPVGGIPEGEADIPDEGLDFTNGGCNSSPTVFSPISVGQTICGMANTYLYGGSQYRDTDWYRLDLTGSGNFWDLSWTINAEFPFAIFIVDGGTENCSDYVVLNSTSGAKCTPTTITATGLAPKVYWVMAMPSVFTGVPAGSNYVVTLAGTPLGLPIANITPSSFTKAVGPGASTTDALNVGNTGTYGMNYTANVVYPAKASITVYPLNANYNTGTCSSSAFTQTSLMNGYGYETGFAKFDLSAIPAGATITSIDFNGYVNASSWPYWSITPLPYDPLVTAAATMNSYIVANYGSTVAYSYNTESSSISGWIARTLGNTAVADCQAALAQGWFSLGITDWDFTTSYYIDFDGWNEANKPYLVINYSTIPFWLTIDGAQNTSGSVPAGGNNIHTIGFNSAGLPIGTYTADIAISTNEPGAKASYLIPVTFHVGWGVSGNVYYGTTGTTKPMQTNTTVTLTPGPTVPTGAGGAYLIRPVANGSFKLFGATTKAWGGLQAFDATLIARYLGSIVTFTNLQKRAADLNLSSTITAFDGTLIKRRLGSIATPQWTAPTYVFDGPFPTTPTLDGLPVTVSGADVIQELRTICSGDLNSSFTPPAE
jgi:hypothetical protein